MKKLILVAVTLWMALYAASSFAAITITDGFWSTTFNCADWDQDAASTTCDGITLATGGWKSTEGLSTSVTSDANNSAGAGSKGYRQWISDGVNAGSISEKITFPSAQPEIWIRWYMRFQSGFVWSVPSPYLHYDKWLYLYAGNYDGGETPKKTQVVVTLHDKTSIRLTNENSTPPYPDAAYGWQDFFGGADWTVASDGHWICVEIYLKMDTITGGVSDSNGIGRIWIDGTLRAEHTAVNWSNTNTTSVLGWTYFDFMGNQSSPANGGDRYNDTDDMAIATPAYTNFCKDSAGNNMIGPLGCGTSGPSHQSQLGGIRSTIGSGGLQNRSRLGR